MVGVGAKGDFVKKSNSILTGLSLGKILSLVYGLMTGVVLAVGFAFTAVLAICGVYLIKTGEPLKGTLDLSTLITANSSAWFWILVVVIWPAATLTKLIDAAIKWWRNRKTKVEHA